MESIKPLSDFFAATAGDGRISLTHIAVYAALLHYRALNGFRNPIQAYSHQVMPLARISAQATYHRCIKELHEYGYIRYCPSFKRNQASTIHFPE